MRPNGHGYPPCRRLGGMAAVAHVGGSAGLPFFLPYFDFYQIQVSFVKVVKIIIRRHQF